VVYEASLSIADKLAVRALLLRAQVVTENLVEALQANAAGVFLLVVANLRAAPDALDQKSFFSFFKFAIHSSYSFLLCLH